jgi:hypothetical protein
VCRARHSDAMRCNPRATRFREWLASVKPDVSRSNYERPRTIHKEFPTVDDQQRVVSAVEELALIIQEKPASVAWMTNSGS